MTPELWLDERGRRCPLPVIALARAQTQWLELALGRDQVVCVLADDPAARFDIPAWCRLKGAVFLGEVCPPDARSGTGYVVRFTSEKQPG
ncbi:MAG: sulfurtransferase TusA family protein [Candidatus Nanopelagicales bacterium]